MKTHQTPNFPRLLKHADPWTKRHIQGWKNFKGGTAWTMIDDGPPTKVRVQVDGFLDEWPHHIAFCEILSMNPSVILKHGGTKTAEWWKLVQPDGRMVWARRGPRRKVQYAERQGRKTISKRR
jgi:hypothetical protein